MMTIQGPPTHDHQRHPDRPDPEREEWPRMLVDALHRIEINHHRSMLGFEGDTSLADDRIRTPPSFGQPEASKDHMALSHRRTVPDGHSVHPSRTLSMDQLNPSSSNP